jgi:hypothetical protein
MCNAKWAIVDFGSHQDERRASYSLNPGEVNTLAY